MGGSTRRATGPHDHHCSGRCPPRGAILVYTRADNGPARVPAGSPELLFGDPAALRGRSDRCWWLHHDGIMGAGLGAALASDGTVLVVWIVSEG